MKLLLINNAEPADSAFNQPLIDAVSTLAETDVVFGPEAKNVAISDYDAVVVSGVPRHYAFETIEPLRERLAWLRDTDVPTLGICLGHQAIGTLFGAELIRNTEAELGKYTLDVRQDDPILAGLGRRFVIDALHRASISLPKNFVLLASSTTCRNQIMRHADRPIYSMQFHPELSATGIKMLGNFAKIAAHYQARQDTDLLYLEQT